MTSFENTALPRLTNEDVLCNASPRPLADSQCWGSIHVLTLLT